MSRKSQRIQSREFAAQIPNILNRKRKVADLSPEDQSADESDCRKRQSWPRCIPFSIAEDTSDAERSPSDPEWITSRLTLRYSQLTCLSSPSQQHQRFPLPELCWADPTEVWQTMIEKESLYRKDPRVLDRHPAIQSRMRSILLDWIMEVCEAYAMHRETYYIAMDCVDRFLSSQHDIPKQHLQLIGITALFIASKIEEIYPPKLEEFSYVTDGACSTGEIITHEMIMLKALKWVITPVTANCWLNTFMQLSNKDNIKNTKENFVFPNYSGCQFVQIAKLLDLCMLDVESLQFSNRCIAASALYHTTTPGLFAAVTGYRLEEVQSCVTWMTPFAMVVRESGIDPVKNFPQVAKDDMHNIQTHVFDLTLLDSVQERQAHILSSVSSSPMAVVGILTPPQSREK